jgi:hypothetical protein
MRRLAPARQPKLGSGLDEGERKTVTGDLAKGEQRLGARNASAGHDHAVGRPFDHRLIFRAGDPLVIGGRP